MTAIFFNLLANSTFSLLIGMIVVGFFLWIFRVETGPWKVLLLSFPFIKIIYDLVRGIPADSILLAGLDPYSLPAKHQLLQVGAGFKSWGPVFSVVFSVKDLNGVEYAASAGDYIIIWLHRHFGSIIPLIIISFVTAAALLLILIRLVQAIKFERKRRRDRKNAQAFRVAHLKFRNIDIYISDAFSGTPFTGGLIHPYICIPRDSFVQLSSDELEAVIAHELGHIHQFDLLVTIAIQILGDCFWFIPGYRFLSKKIDRLREIVADQWAIKNGADPTFLASALVKLKQIPETSDSVIVYSAFYRQKSLLKQRVEILLGSTIEKHGRFGWQNKYIRTVVSFWIFMSVINSNLIANQGDKFQSPKWLEQFLNSIGL